MYTAECSVYTKLERDNYEENLFRKEFQTKEEAIEDCIWMYKEFTDIDKELCFCNYICAGVLDENNEFDKVFFLIDPCEDK